MKHKVSRRKTKREKILEAYRRGGMEEVRNTRLRESISYSYVRSVLKKEGIEVPRDGYTSNKLRRSRVVAITAALMKGKTTKMIVGEMNVTRQYVQMVADAFRANGIDL